MPTQKEIQRLFESTGRIYQRCWETLCLLKHYRSNPENGKKILQFQPELAKALLDLETTYNALSKEKRHIIAHKSALPLNWFQRRLKAISQNQHSIRQVIYLGKSLGDAFVWVFYRDESELLLKHLTHPAVSRFPTGIGGIGEVSAAKEARHIQGRILLLHSITNILRVGDASLIDPDTLKIIALVEIKTSKVDDKTLGVKLHIAGSSQKLSFLTSLIHSSPESNPVDNRIRDRLRKQMGNMSKSIEAQLSETGNPRTKVQDETYFPQLERLLHDSQSRMLKYQISGPGMLLMAYRDRSTSFTSRFLKNTKPLNLKDQLEPSVKAFLGTFNNRSTFNSAIVNSFPFGPHGEIAIYPGMAPVFWWPLEDRFLRDIYFRQTLLFSVYNPAHFMDSLRDIGFSIIDLPNRNTFKLELKQGKRILEFGGLNHFITLITTFMLTEKALLSVIRTAIEEANKAPQGRPGRIILKLTQAL